MHSFRLVPASEGPRREFKITLGLRAGYGSAGRIYRLEEAIRTAHRWMRERAARGAPFLSGMVTRGEVSTPIPEVTRQVHGCIRWIATGCCPILHLSGRVGVRSGCWLLDAGRG
jgi:hypothetical protein